MTSVPEFNCIFCNETFEDKESLQIHFRKHGDPKFNQKRFLVTQNDTKMSNEKSNDQVEMVNCDVCPEVFTTISKAITHKHKVHPDHDAKYFCPWCGKLFTMKHLYNKHIQANHNNVGKSEEKCFHCDACNVDFFVPMAMLYHNKFFHRQDTDMPSVGLSKKLKLYNQEAVQIYYCAFCGEEYENKVNLQKHISDDHSDENQSPDEVLRCPICEAIFYHLDAYEIHLTFHSTDDLYNDKNEMRNEITEFSLETVAPITEKVENIEPKDAETTMNAMGIDQFLQLAMDESDDSTPKKSKKKKKHRKSKTHAITLDEFLNMNKDVFGEEIDFQGVEEIPTQVVAKHLKANKKQTANVKKGSKFITQTNLEKLKQQGIVVKKKSVNNSCVMQNVNEGKQLPGNSLKVPQKIISNKIKPNTKTPTESNILSTSNEMLSKLINQSNNQIKIVKKTIQDKNITEDRQEKTVMSPEENKANLEHTEKVNSDKIPIKKTINELNKNDIEKSGEIVDNKSILCNEFKSVSQYADKNILGERFTDKDEVQLGNDDSAILKDVSPKETIDSISLKQGLNDSYSLRNINHSVSKSIVPSENDDGNDKKTDLLNFEKSDHESHLDNFEENDLYPVKSNITSQNTESLSALKHLSHLITVKPVNQVKSTNDFIESKFTDQRNIDTNNIQPINSEHTTLNDTDMSQISRTSPKNTSTKTIDVLKNINKNIIIKSLTQSPQSCKKVKQEDHSDDDDYFEDDSETDLSISDRHLMKKINTGVKIKTESTEPYLNTKNNSKQPKIDCHAGLPSSKHSNTSLDTSVKEHNTHEEKSIKDQTNTNLLKLPPNVTVKSLNMTKQVIEKSSQSIKNNYTQKYVKSKEIHEDIEIFNIDDSDSDDNKESNKNPKCVDNPTNSYKSETCALHPMHALKNLGKNIIIKNMNRQITSFSNNSEATLPNENYSTQSDDSNDTDLNQAASLKEIKSHVDLHTPESKKSLAIQHALKNLGKNIIVKSRNSSPSQSVTSQDHSTQDSNFEKKNDSDSDSCSNNVKITEIENNHISDTENEIDPEQYNETDKNAIIQSPNDSCSENEDMADKEDQTSDTESQLRLHKLAKLPQNITVSKNSTCLNNLRSINKDVTIKSLNDNKKQITIAEENTDLSNNLSNQLTVRPYKQTKFENQNNSIPGNINPNIRQMTRCLNNSSNSQNSAASNHVNTINKEVTVKTFQTQTVIEEITTTVTKTIRTVNQSIKQEVQSQSSTAHIVKPRTIQGNRPSFQPSQALQGTTVRHITPPIGSKIRNAAPSIRPGVIVRPSKQIGLRPGLTLRPTTPRMPVTPRPSTSGQQKPMMGKTLKISPHAVTTSINKRPRSEEVSGHFSCFKKPKESLIPVSDVPAFSNIDANTITHSASHVSKSNVTTTKVVKGNSVVTSTQMKSQVCTSSEQLNKLSSVSGLKIMKTCQIKQSEIQEKCGKSAPKQTTLEAIQKLQKQGLLVKKPRLDNDDESEHSKPYGDNNAGYCSKEENDD